jgi:hypothetical protein
MSEYKVTLQTGQEIEFIENDLDIFGIGTITYHELISQTVHGYAENGTEITGKVYMIRQIIGKNDELIIVLDVISTEELEKAYSQHNLDELGRSLIAETCKVVDDNGLSIYKI